MINIFLFHHSVLISPGKSIKFILPYFLLAWSWFSTLIGIFLHNESQFYYSYYCLYSFNQVYLNLLLIMIAISLSIHFSIYLFIQFHKHELYIKIIKHCTTHYKSTNKIQHDPWLQIAHGLLVILWCKVGWVMLCSVGRCFLYYSMAVYTYTDEGKSSTVEVTFELFLKYNAFTYRMRT